MNIDNPKYSFLFWLLVPITILASVALVCLFINTQIQSSATRSSAGEAQAPQFKPQLLSWSQVTQSAQWQPRDSAASFVFQDRIWTMGGLNGNQNVDINHMVRYWEAPHFNDIWATQNGVDWELAKEHAEWPPRRSMSVIPFQDKLWMFGGWSPITGYTSDIWQSGDGITWTKVVIQAPWTPREGQVALVFQEKIWLIGGVNYDKRETKNDVWYSEDGLVWTQTTTTIPWNSRWDHAAAVFNGKIFLTGGMDLLDQTFGDIWSSPDGLNWELVTTSPPWQKRQGHSLVVFKNRLWLIGKLTNGVEGDVNDVWYSSDGVSWQKTDADPTWIGREDHSTLIFNDLIYVFGGMGSNWQWQNDVWVSQVNDGEAIEQ